MAQVKIADLVKKTTPAETDLMVIQDAGATKGITWSDLFSPIYNWLGNLATLKTAHKNTFVGVANELFDKIEAVEANNSLSEPVSLGNGVSYRTVGKVCMVSISNFTGGSVSGLPPPAGYVLIRLWTGSTTSSYIQHTAGGGWTSTGTGGYGSAVYLMQ